MKNTLKKIVLGHKRLGGQQISKSKMREIEHRWDIESAYFSNALEGSRLKRKAFERLAKNH
jgi:hypothetical protein